MRYVFIWVFPNFLDTLYRFIMTEIIELLINNYNLFTNQHLPLMYVM
jgi:hypothetical protein